MTAGIALTLLGFGLGTLITVGGRSSPRETATTLRERAIEAQKTSARASELARALAAQWSAEASRSETAKR